MLYDKRWDAKVEAHPLSLDGVIAWLEQQLADTEYNWLNPADCIACRFLTDTRGYDRPWYDLHSKHKMWYEDLFGTRDIYHAIGRPTPWTFGAALDRAREFQRGV